MCTFQAVHYSGVPSGNPDGMARTPGNANTALAKQCLSIYTVMTVQITPPQ